VLLERALAAAARNLRGPLAQLGDELLHPRAPLVELLRGLDLHPVNSKAVV
jgi:hypothetical protein